MENTSGAFPCIWSTYPSFLELKQILLMFICVPQGSVLGSWHFFTSAASVISLIISHGFQAHIFPDDMQAYCHCFSQDQALAVTLFQNFANI